MKKFYLVAGEASGDTRGAELMRCLRELGGDEVVFSGAGGPKMGAFPGTEQVRDWTEEAAVVGLWEVLKKYPYFRGEMDRVCGEIAAGRPDAVILIDYPGFNLRLAKNLRKENKALKIVYYISPQVWAWNRGRIPKMAAMLDLMVCIFPFEKVLYENSGLKTVFAGHPIVSELGPLRGAFEREENLVGLFPGSRRREVEKLFPVMLDAAELVRKNLPETRFMAAAASVSLARLMRKQVEMSPLMGEIDCEIVRDRAYEVMQRAACGIIASGTATLEAAFFGLPYCLVYKAAWPTYLACKALITVDHLGIVNILAEREVVKEFLQGDADPKKIAREMLRLLDSEEAREELSRELLETAGKLGEKGAALRAAGAIMESVFPGSA